MKNLIWTKKIPTEEGWYWKRKTGMYAVNFGEELGITYIRNYAGKLCIMNWEIPKENVEWAGPIPEPVDLEPEFHHP